MTTSNFARTHRPSPLLRKAAYVLLACASIWTMAATLHVNAQNAKPPAADPHAAHKQEAAEKKQQQDAKTKTNAKTKTTLPKPQATPDPHAGHHEHMKAAEAASKSASNGQNVKMAIPDLELLDQDGKKVRFYTDLVKGRVVVINFIFTTCTTICPPLGATFARVQRDLGERTGRDVHFISVSVDPVTDTPERLKAWGAKFKAGAGWTFVTGDKQRMDELLRALASSVARREDHSPTVIIGNDAKGTWTRAYGLAKPSQLVAIIDGMLNDGAASSSIK